ncbi:unnamed protein product [Adineta ricciae]|uniref:NAD(P)(+)--arginine ADP-ribosyltransferase n=1 Tax=Adineta ricciae TaxID=249248 RepID=A0A815L1F6_ADIRI|nr:unnamed protein product [Adineta ricciae]
MGSNVSARVEPTSARPDKDKNDEGIILIWIGSVPVGETESALETKLKSITSSVKLLSDLNTSIAFVKSITKERIFVILNVNVNETTNKSIKELNQISHVSSIFIIDSSENPIQSSENVSEERLKAMRFSSFDRALMDTVRHHIRTAVKTMIGISMFDQEKQNTTRDLTKNMAGFLWFQILLQVLKELQHDDQAKNEMLEMCSNYYRMQDDQSELAQIEEYRTTYKKEQAIHWYTRDSFLYKLLNKALRTEDVRSLFSFRTFIVDLCAQIDDLHRKQFGTGNAQIMLLFRGQRMTNREHAQLLTSQNKLVSTNGFISATKSIDVARGFAFQNTLSNDLIPVLFQIQVSSRLEHVRFADIAAHSVYQGEAEVLFSLGAAFKITNVHEGSGDHSLTVVTMVATDDGYKSVNRYINASRAEYESEDKKVILGRLLLDMGQYRESRDYFTDLIDYTSKRRGTSDSLEFAPFYHNKGRALAAMGLLIEALRLMERAGKIYRKESSMKTRELVQVLNSIGVIEGELGHYQKALQNFRDVLNEFKHLDSSGKSSNSQLQIATAESNIGWVLYLKGSYRESCEHHTNAYKIRQAHLPDKHPLLADSLNALGALQHAQGLDSVAKKAYTTVLTMRLQVLPDRHPSIASSYQSLGNLQLENGRYDDASKLYEDAHSIYTETFGENHPFVGNSYKSLGSVSLENSNFEQALEYFELARQILTRNFSEKHPSVGECHHLIGIVHERKKMFKKAISYYEMALDIFSQDLDVDHPIGAKVFISLANTYMRTNDFEQAERNLQRAYEIQKKAYAHDHPEILLTLNNFGVLHTQTQQYDKAKDYLNQALNMCKKYDEIPHLATARTKYNAGVLHATIGEYSVAIMFYKSAIDIQEQKLPSTNLHVIEIHNAIADVYMREGKFIEAQQHLMKAKSRYESNHCTKSNPDYTRIEKNLKKISKLIKR